MEVQLYFRTKDLRLMYLSFLFFLEPGPNKQILNSLLEKKLPSNKTQLFILSSIILLTVVKITCESPIRTLQTAKAIKLERAQKGVTIVRIEAIRFVITRTFRPPYFEESKPPGI